jgi:ABC-type sugar transport system ATPase subunit
MAPAIVYAVECDSVSKKYGGKFAVDSASLQVESGKVHALVGENGAGKSTLLGIISGRVSADSGSVTVFGDELRSSSPRATRAHGLVVVYQELTMVPGLTAAENMFLGQNSTRSGFLRTAFMRASFVAMARDFDVHIDPDALARDLSISQQQIVEIMRGVQAKGRILMLDEPSAALAEAERDTLYRILSRLREQGTTIVFVSHNLDEVLQLSDSITVLRDGKVVKTAARTEWDKPALVREMVGRDVIVERRTDISVLGSVAISATGINYPGVLHDISVTAHSGEIVGLWGLVGSGRTTFMRSLSGLEPRSSGTLELAGVSVQWPRSARAAIRNHVVMVPESRKQGLVPGMDGVSNFWLGRRSVTRGWLSPRREFGGARDRSTYFGFNPRRLTEPVRNLSGGNQQKVLLAKWAGRDPKVLLVDEPTRGIDVGAKAEVLSSLVSLAKDGATIIVTSSELEEVLAICDRLLVFSHGRIVREIETVTNPYSVGDIVKFGFGEEEVA